MLSCAWFTNVIVGLYLSTLEKPRVVSFVKYLVPGIEGIPSYILFYNAHSIQTIEMLCCCTFEWQDARVLR